MRNHTRIHHRLPIELHCEERQQLIPCHTENICAGGMLVSGASCMRKGDEVRISLKPEGCAPLTLKGRVIRQTGDHCALTFVDVSPATSRQLHKLLTPHWDGHDLLEGVITIAPWIERDDLATWMRYTSLLADWRYLTSAVTVAAR